MLLFMICDSLGFTDFKETKGHQTFWLWADRTMQNIAKLIPCSKESNLWNFKANGQQALPDNGSILQDHLLGAHDCVQVPFCGFEDLPCDAVEGPCGILPLFPSTA
jgi:hypothetical protein